MEVQEDGARRRAEAVHDLRRRGDKRARLERLLLVVDEHGHAAIEHVERVGVPAMEVRVGAVARVREVRLRDAELLERRLEDDPAVEQRLALARPEQHACHRGRVCT